ncbi:molybdate ABC transporter substrate-binding protein [Salmonella enterica subsp. enterica]|nr:molybdate ABC transporter substrate-binding protein [Salmonella enterica subsp. enterica]
MRILAAGSLRVVWPQLMAAFQADAVCDFGPAGLLRERIEAGEACDFFASANLAHPQALLESGRALRVAPFTTNRLCLSVRAQAMREGEDWLSLLTRRDLRIGTSTAGCDPSGDYTQQLFSRMGKEGEAVRKRAVALVGGRQTLPLPAAGWQRNGSSIMITPISLSAMPAMLPGYGRLIRCEWLISRNLIIPWLNMALPA